MGYGFGAFLLAVGLILALAVQDAINGVDLVMVGWILAAVGAGTIALSAISMASSNRSRSVTTHPDGSQTVQDSRTA